MAESFEMLLHNDIPEAITDKNLNILHANEPFFRICGDNYYLSFRKFIHEDYLPVFEKYMTAAQKTGYSTFPAKILHCINENEKRSYDDYLDILYSKETERFVIRVYDIRSALSSLASLDFDVKKYRQIFTVENDVIFEYNYDTGWFEMYLISGKQNVTLYDGDFDEWTEKMTNGGYVNKDDIAVFKAFCTSIKSAEQQCSGKFRSRIIGKNGNEDLNKVTLHRISDHSGTTHMVGTWNIFNELTQKKVEHLMDDIYMDPLTQILNKSKITEYAQDLISRRPTKKIALCIIDIDNFKKYNDTFGHLFGDEIIKGFADVTKSIIGDYGVCGRIGGDEFLVVLEKYSDELELRNFLRAIRTNVQWLFREKLANMQLSCSIGVSQYPENAKDYKTMFLIADKALYIAKEKGKNRYIIYRPHLHGALILNDKDNDKIKVGDSMTDNFDKLGSILSRIYTDKTAVMPLLEILSRMYFVERISLFSSELKCLCEFNPNGVSRGGFCARKGFVMTDSVTMSTEEYLSAFNDDNSFILDNVHTIEFTNPELYKLLSDCGTKSTAQFKLRNNDGKVVGYVIYDSCSVNRQWTEESIKTLTLVSKILGNTIS